MLGGITANQMSILTTDQLEDTNRTIMEQLSFSETTIGLKEFAIGSAQLGNKFITKANQVITSIDR